VSDIELADFVLTNGLPAYERNTFVRIDVEAEKKFAANQPYELKELVPTLPERIYECIFKLDDIIEFEERHGLRRSSKRQAEAPIKNDQSTMEDGETHAPVIAFYKEGDYWMVGAEGKEKPLKYCMGFSILHFLLEHPSQEIPALQVYHRGDFPTENFPRSIYEDDLRIDAFDTSPQIDR
jgi:hypothetical protein